MKLDQATSARVSAALLRLRTRAPFFATLALFARIEASECVPTAATDGRAIFLNTTYFGALSAAAQAGLLLHEVLHAALLHLPRRGGRDALLWNIAADIVVNGMVRVQEGFDLPLGALYDQEIEHLSVEEVYEILLQDLARHPTLAWKDLLEYTPVDCEGDTVAGGSSMTNERRTALEAYWYHAQQQAMLVVQGIGHGNFPAGLQRELQHLRPAQLNWRAYLWRYLVQTPVDFSGFDRRFVGRGLYLEALEGERVRVFVGVDTSGSVHHAELQSFLNEVQGIVSAYPHLSCTLFYVDARLYGPYDLGANAAIPTPTGGGGTDFRPFFAHVAAEHDTWQTPLVVYLTDGYGTFPTDPPSLPVLWVVTPGGLDLEAFPFGETVRLLPSA